MRRRMIVAAVDDEIGDLEGTAIGVGGIRSAVGFSGLLASDTPDEVVLVGTCGVYPAVHDRIAIGEACVAVTLGWASGTAALGKGYVPRPPAPLDADPDLVAELTASGLQSASVLTVPAISTDPELVERLGADYALEHMEAYSVAYACAQRGIRFVAVLGVANVVGPEAHEQYLENRERAQEAARRAVRGR